MLQPSPEEPFLPEPLEPKRSSKMESPTAAVAPVVSTNHVNNSIPPRRSAALGGTELTLIEVKPMRFLLMDAPRQTNVHLYLKEMGKYHVTDVVRVCEPTYPTTDLQNAGIHVHEMEYKDGSSPSKELILSWLQLVEKTFYASPPDSGAAIAVHCVAGLGRAPVMIAIALIEFGAMDPIDAVRFIRERRRGAINNNQLNYLQGYKKCYKRGGGGGSAATACGCVIS